jgi:hypothetical protein
MKMILKWEAIMKTFLDVYKHITVGVAEHYWLHALIIQPQSAGYFLVAICTAVLNTAE